MVIYLSGPMTGLFDLNYKEFKKWAKFFRDRGHQVLNPAENDGGSKDKDRTFYMRLDVDNIMIADGVVLLDGWRNSTGVKFELALAHELGIPVYPLETFKMGSMRKMKYEYSTNITEVAS